MESESGSCRSCLRTFTQCGRIGVCTASTMDSGFCRVAASAIVRFAACQRTKDCPPLTNRYPMFVAPTKFGREVVVYPIELPALPAPTEKRPSDSTEVACELPNGTLIVHPESEKCEVCEAGGIAPEALPKSDHVCACGHPFAAHGLDRGGKTWDGCYECQCADFDSGATPPPPSTKERAE